MYEPENFEQTVYRVVNLTTDLICSDFGEGQEQELNTYLRICQDDFPHCEYAVYKIFQTHKEIRIK